MNPLNFPISFLVCPIDGLPGKKISIFLFFNFSQFFLKPFNFLIEKYDMTKKYLIFSQFFSAFNFLLLPTPKKISIFSIFLNISQKSQEISNQKAQKDLKKNLKKNLNKNKNQKEQKKSK